MSHLKRHVAPKFWPIERRKNVWTTKPSPGPHQINRSIPLIFLIRDVLVLAENAREARIIIKQGKISVDKRIRKDPRLPLGLMDVVEIPDIKKYFRVTASRKGLVTEEISSEETSKKTCKIEDKRTIKGGLTQLNLHDGRNIIVKTNEYKPGDSLVIGLPDQSILEHYPFDKGSPVKIMGGKNIGLDGQILEIHERKTLLEKNKVIIEVDGKKIETLKNHLLVTGKSGQASSQSTEKKKSKIK